MENISEQPLVVSVARLVTSSQVCGGLYPCTDRAPSVRGAVQCIAIPSSAAHLAPVVARASLLHN